ncbi:hypothetical protein BDV95DRAFT_589948 [Massariosphaeria phaeospora]|uniref:Uncharacterized protein n=1 Tax=Massariosphaeria phaeospora TaxID=100035 RepID=A0A7C8IE35_9PLEO|nr:hypothetical protein BDV95DRAFT_589948 [Massariosphaeria phaeospora]
MPGLLEPTVEIPETVPALTALVHERDPLTGLRSRVQLFRNQNKDENEKDYMNWLAKEKTRRGEFSADMFMRFDKLDSSNGVQSGDGSGDCEHPYCLCSFALFTGKECAAVFNNVDYELTENIDDHTKYHYVVAKVPRSRARDGRLRACPIAWHRYKSSGEAGELTPCPNVFGPLPDPDWVTHHIGISRTGDGQEIDPGCPRVFETHPGPCVMCRAEENQGENPLSGLVTVHNVFMTARHFTDGKFEFDDEAWLCPVYHDLELTEIVEELEVLPPSFHQIPPHSSDKKLDNGDRLVSWYQRQDMPRWRPAYINRQIYSKDKYVIIKCPLDDQRGPLCLPGDDD